MNPFDEMKAWIGFGEEDAARLALLLPMAEPHLPALSEVFYERILANPEARGVLTGPDQVERLKRTLTGWARELLAGPHDEAYFGRRQQIGRRHVDVGLPSRYMFLAMSVYRERLCAIATASFGIVEAHGTCASIGKVCDLDLAIMNTTYVRGREAQQLAILQDVVVSHLQAAVLLLNAEGTVVAFTPGAAALLAVSSPSGIHWEHAVAPAMVENPAVRDGITAALAGASSRAIPRLDLQIHGRSRQFKVSVTTLAHPLARALIQMEDITDSLEAESKAQRMEALAQIGALSAAVAHELRNPLAGISGAIQVIARSLPGDDRRKPIMEKVERQVWRLDALVSDLLAFARPTTPELEPMDLAQAARVVGDLVSREFPDCRVVVKGDGSALADAGLVHQIILNLVQNAAQAQEGVGLVAVEVSPGRVDVNDDGPGVPEAHRDQIFTPFYTTRAKGTGLGLAIVKKHAGLMGGNIELVEGHLKGACFRLELLPG